MDPATNRFPSRGAGTLLLPAVRTIHRPTDAEKLLAAASVELETIERALHENQLVWDKDLRSERFCALGDIPGDIQALVGRRSGQITVDRVGRPRCGRNVAAGGVR